MPEQPAQPTKRARTLPRLPARDSNDCSGSECDDLPSGERPGPAARKRELERQRRNLVSTRFLELDRVLSLDGAATGKDPLPQQTRRLDKEAILKDAAARITTQASDLRTAQERLAFMSNEVENLRAEKVELRADKTYLHSELTAIRSEVHRLRADNILLWQSMRRSGGLKSALSTDVAKIPADILLKVPSVAQAVAPTGLGTAVEPIGRPLNAVTEAALQSDKSHPSCPDGRDQEHGYQRPRGQSELQLGSFLRQNLESASAKQQRPSSGLQAPSSGQGGGSFGSQGPRQDGRVDDKGEMRLEVESTSLVDSFLVFQSAEELGELFADYVQQPNPVLAPNRAVHPNDVRADVESASPSWSQQPSLSVNLVATGTTARANSHASETQKVAVLPASSPVPPSIDDSKLIEDAPVVNDEEHEADDDFLADIAYCA
jgi:hypothetical protein